MKNRIPYSSSTPRRALPLRAGDPSSSPTASATSWATLEQQSRDLAADIQARNAHPFTRSITPSPPKPPRCRKARVALPPDRKQKLDSLLIDMAAQAKRAHVDGHKRQMGRRRRGAQKQFATDLAEAKALFTPASAPAAKP